MIPLHDYQRDILEVMTQTCVNDISNEEDRAFFRYIDGYVKKDKSRTQKICVRHKM